MSWPRAVARTVVFRTTCLLLRVRTRFQRPRLVVYCAHVLYIPKCEAVAGLLRARGYRVELRHGTSFWTRAVAVSSPWLWIGVWTMLPGRFFPRKFIFWNAEPLDKPRKRVRVTPEYFEMMRRARAVWGYQQWNAKPARELGVRFRYVPFGYSPSYETSYRRHTKGDRPAPDIDALFVGTMCERRERVIAGLRHRGLNVHVVSGRDPIFGRELDELFARSKIVLAIFFYDDSNAQVVDFARIDNLLANRVFVIHERPTRSLSDPAFERHVSTCEYDDFADTCAYFVARPDERAQRAEAAYEWFKTEYNLADLIPYDDIAAILAEQD